MYRVVISNEDENFLIHSEQATNYPNQPLLISGSLKQGINTIPSFIFSYTNANPAFNNLNPLKTLITVTDSKRNKEVFRGRVTRLEDGMGESGEFSYSAECESDLAFLLDSVQPFYKVQNTSVTDFIIYLLTIHNNQVEEYKKIFIGNVTVTSSNDNVYYYVDDSATTFDTIKDKLLDRLGGELQLRHENGVNYLDYLLEIGEESTTKIAITRNMLSISKISDPLDVITRIFPRGAKVTDSSNTDASQPRLTISSVNGGVDYIDASNELIERYGINGKAVVWDDVTVPSNLKTKGENFLINQKVIFFKYSVKAADLSLLNLDTDTYVVGNRYLTINNFVGVSEYLRIVGMTIDIINPQVSSLTIGDRQLTQTEFQIELNKNNQVINNLSFSVNSQTERLNATNENVLVIENDVLDLKNEVGNIDVTAINSRLNVLESDTGWLDINVTGGVTNSTLQFRKVDKDVFFRGNATIPLANAEIKIADLEVGITPEQDIFKRIELIENGIDVAAISIRDNGEMFLEFSSGTGKAYAFDSINYLI